MIALSCYVLLYPISICGNGYFFSERSLSLVLYVGKIDVKFTPNSTDQKELLFLIDFQFLQLLNSNLNTILTYFSILFMF